MHFVTQSILNCARRHIDECSRIDISILGSFQAIVAGGGSGTGKIEDGAITKLVRKHFELRPAGLIKMLDLLRPVYLPTASYGHFGRPEFSWENTDRAEALRADAKIKK